ncbi:hypothetical protein BJV74DRAFT_576246 [Russula compacta]|nr:hypothetical protein BJV74DRAFT_576246 [Russula compacta]
MDSATDTDSEADRTCATPHPTRTEISPCFRSSPIDRCSSLKEVHAAVQDLQNVETRLLVKDITYANTIRRASSILVCAIRELAMPDSTDHEELIEVFKEITGEWSLSKLLANRRAFRSVGVLSISVKGALVSWVDVILANIAMTSVYIASDTVDTDGMEGTLARQKEDEAIQAASRLPYTWAEMLDLLTSNMASCTVFRLSLRLTFAAYILHPQLSGMKPQVDAFTPKWLTKVVRNYLSRIFSTKSVVHEYSGDDTLPVRSTRDRIVFAMILVLCSVGNRISLLITVCSGDQTDKPLC